MTSLISLPVEVLDQILGYLTPHQQLHDIKVMKPSIENIAYQQDKKFKLPGLLNLSITCKTLGRMIQPIIFHSFVQHDNFWNNDDSPPAFLHHLGKFLRTLVERPDLAQVVQIVDIEIFDQRCDCCYNTLDRMTEEETIWIAEYSAKTGLPMDTSDTSTIATLATQRESNTWDSWDVAEALIQNLLLMTPNLSRLNLCLPRDWNFKPLMEWSRHIDLKTGSRPEFLQNVRHMELEIQVDDSNDRYMCDEDEMPGVGHEIPSPIEQLLVDAAPNVEVLCCSSGGLAGPRQFSKLDSLQILMKGSWIDMLSPMMNSLPPLRRFSYKATSNTCPFPQEVQDALAPHRESLEYLDIVMEPWIGTGRSSRVRSYQVSSFRDFTALKTLNLDGAAIWTDPGEDGEYPGSVQSDPDLLSNLLPPSLVELHVEGDSNQDEEYEDHCFKSLARAMAGGNFPHLRFVSWHAGDKALTIDTESAHKVWDDGNRWRRDVPHQSRGSSWARHRAQYVYAFPQWMASYNQALLEEFPGCPYPEALEKLSSSYGL